jgi:flavin reductase (DIM6/NTAB) family NADH-FMN oxidoreductase RutF
MDDREIVSHWLPCPVVFISTAFGGKRDIMTATAMFISEKEALLIVSVAKDHLTAKLIEQAKGFTLIIASQSQKHLVWELGSTRGDAGDKFSLFNINTLSSDSNKPLIPADASAWFECCVISQQEINGCSMFIARVTDQQDLGKPALVWQKQALFTLKPV